MAQLKDLLATRTFFSEQEKNSFIEGFKVGVEQHGGHPVEIIGVIDDDENVLNMMSANLSQHGYQVLTGSSGKECLQMLNVNRPDIVIVDLGLQDINGEDISDVIQRDPQLSRMGVILISGLLTLKEATDLNQNEIARSKHKRYVSKPFSMENLFECIREIRNLQDRDGVTPWAPPLPLEIHFDHIPISVSKELGTKKITEEMTVKEKIAEYIGQGYKPESFRPIITEVLSSGKIRLEVEGRSERIVLSNPDHHMVRAYAEELFDRYYPNRAAAFPNRQHETQALTRHRIAVTTTTRVAIPQNSQTPNPKASRDSKQLSTPQAVGV